MSVFEKNCHVSVVMFFLIIYVVRQISYEILQLKIAASVYKSGCKIYSLFAVTGKEMCKERLLHIFIF